LSAAEILAFRRALEARMIEAYRWDLWAAAALIRDGCSESAFRNFRAWLIAQGREAFEAALADPESLAENAALAEDDSAQYPALLSIPFGVYQEKTGQPLPEVDPPHPARPAGPELPLEPSALRDRFPRLFQAFLRDEWLDAPAEPAPDLPPSPAGDVPPMAEDRFWALIEESRERARGRPLQGGEDFIDRHIEAHTEVLSRLSPEDLIAYDERFYLYQALAYRWDLWGAAYWLHGGCSDDAFIDFRSCLVSLGKEWFFRVLGNPDALTDLVGRADVPYLQAEGFQYVASRVYREKTGQDTMPATGTGSGGPAEPDGERFDFEDEDEMRQRFPRLLARFPEMGD
jgi:hypothetical protein